MTPPHAEPATPLLRATGLRKAFPLPGGRRLLAVDGVDLALERGRTLAVVGESGCGKSTLGRLLLRLQPADAGRIELGGAEIGTLPGLALRRRLQVVFQDPYASLDPRQRIRDVLTRPMRLHGLASGQDALHRAAALMERVGLSAALLDRLPHEFSGGQRQRIAIARALTVDPELIICDEPVSALDVSVQAQVINLLQDLQRERGLTLLFISHDLAVVRQLAQSVMVMYAGRVVEAGPVPALFAAPAHPYTRALLAAAPRVDAGPRSHAAMADEPPDPTALPPGCRFAGRCPHAREECRHGPHPPLAPVAADHHSACLFAGALPPWPRPAAVTTLPPRLDAYRRARDAARDAAQNTAQNTVRDPNGSAAA
ncbi:MAG: ABC transporter ATP-binding protein [Janthinobacterium lividum]